MSLVLQSQAIRRTSSANCSGLQQVRHASLLRRPHRPYTFTQLVTLSDGSTFTQRTTSPHPIYRSTKDTRNHPIWQPSLDSLRNTEQDEAGKLRSFRNKFGRGWDAETTFEGDKDGEIETDSMESLMDLISNAEAGNKGAFDLKGITKDDKKKKGKK